MIRKYLLTAKKEFIVTVDNKEILERANHFYEKRVQLKKNERIKFLNIIKN